MSKIKQIPNKRYRKHHCSPLRYPGGKTFLFPFFEEIINDYGLDKITYIEPYAGGAGAALALLISEKVERIVINDFDKAIYAFWKSAIFESDEFIKKMNSTPITVEEWRKQKAIYSDSNSSQFDLGFATFFLNRTNTSGIIEGGMIGGLNQGGDYKIDARFNKERLAKLINQMSSYKSRIDVCNKDGIELIGDYLSKENAFIYLDPPYFDKGSSLYLNHYKKEDHEALAEQLNKYPDAFWLLTYDNKEEIKELYPSRDIVEFSLNYNAYKSRKGEEIMVLSNAFAGSNT